MEFFLSKNGGFSRRPWLESYHTFSFGDYYDENRISFRSLRVINNDKIAPTKGFPFHHHDNMEILTYVVSGSLKHEDSLGNQSIIHAKEMQRMTAGSGILHSEYNPSLTETVHLYQVWIIPSQHNLTPGYEQKHIPNQKNNWTLMVSPSKEGTIKIHQDVQVFIGEFSSGKQIDYLSKRYSFLQVVKGRLSLDSKTLSPGDGVALSPKETALLHFLEESEILLFDLA